MEKKLYKIGEVAKIIGRSNQTIGLWYDAVKNGVEVDAELPEPKMINGFRHFDEDDIQMLMNFRDNIKRGTMAKYNRENKWGKRGEDISKRIEAGEATPKVYKEKKEKEEAE